VKNLGNMLKQAQEMQARMAKMQEELEAREVSGASGGGLVQVTLNGKGAMRRVKIDKTLLEPNEPEVLEDLIVAAHNDAKAKVESEMAAEMGKLTGGLPLPPGFKLPF
jgi:DNA-binding YbaB/EbfC family protein